MPDPGRRPEPLPTGSRTPDPARPARPGRTGRVERIERVLVVDDEPDNVRLLRRILTAAGFAEVEGVSASTRAMDYFLSFDPDIVLLDLRMPAPDGFTLLGEMQAATAPDSFVPIVVLTGDPDPHVRLRALSAGAADFILKPFLPAEVVLRVSNLLSLREQQVQANEYADLLSHQVAERTADLAEEREFLRSLLTCMEAGVLACDAKGNLRLANEALFALGSTRPHSVPSPPAPPPRATSSTATGSCRCAPRPTRCAGPSPANR